MREALRHQNKDVLLNTLKFLVKLVCSNPSNEDIKVAENNQHSATKSVSSDIISSEILSAENLTDESDPLKFNDLDANENEKIQIRMNFFYLSCTF